MEAHHTRGGVGGPTPLVANGHHFNVSLFDHPAKATAAHQEGVARLAIAKQPEQVKAIKRLPGVEKCALLFAKVGTKQVLVDDLLLAVFTQVVATHPLPRSAPELAERLDRTGDSLIPYAVTLLERDEHALKGHLAVTKVLKGKLNFALALVYSDVSAQMQRLVYPRKLLHLGSTETTLHLRG